MAVAGVRLNGLELWLYGAAGTAVLFNVNFKDVLYNLDLTTDLLNAKGSWLFLFLAHLPR